jgi:hypothetical protein
VVAIKLCEVDLFPHFMDIDIGFKFDVFYSFKFLVDSSQDLLIMQKILNLNTSTENLALDNTFGQGI